MTHEFPDHFTDCASCGGRLSASSPNGYECRACWRERLGVGTEGVTKQKPYKISRYIGRDPRIGPEEWRRE